MATSKTLSPTNVTISIPAMSDRPNQATTSNCIDKEADAINQLYVGSTKKFELTSTGSNRNSVLHAWCDTIRSGFSVSEMACMTGIFSGTTYFGMIVKVSAKVITGWLLAPNSNAGFYFRDSSDDSSATSTDFTI